MSGEAIRERLADAGYETEAERRAYADGFSEAMRLVASAASAYAGHASEAAGGEQGADEEGAEPCPECGGERVPALGSEAVCPECDVP